jgi:hypothetical protein
MRSRVLTFMGVVLILGTQTSAQEPMRPAPLGKPSPQETVPSNDLKHCPLPTLKDPGLTFIPGPVFAWARTEDQTTPLVPARRQGAPSGRKKSSEATVEVWDISLPERPKAEAFTANIVALKKQLAVAMQNPPPRHGNLDLAYLMLSDPGRPQDLELARMKSVHLRFNRLPPPRTQP